MRRVVVVLVASSLCGVVAPASAAAPLRTLSGVVTSGVDGSPLDGIEVCATRSTGAETCTQTAGDGTYRLTTREGKVRLRAREPYRYGRWVEQERRLTITRSTTASFTLRPGARATLFLSSDSGPIDPYMSVAAYAVDARGRVAADPYTFSNLGPTASSELAYADVAKLPAGRYVLRMEWNQEGGSHAQAWYPAAATPADAEVITLAEGEERRLEPMALQPPASLTVTATGPKGRRAVLDGARLFDASGREVPAWIHRADVPGRSATFTGLPAGRYRVRLEENTQAYHYVQWFPRAKDLATAGQIGLTAGAATRVTTRLHWPTPRVTRGVRVRAEGFLISVTRRPGWSPRLHYRWDDVHWYRDGRRTDAIGYDYGIERRDVGHRIQACFLAVRRGWARVRTCSPAYRPTSTYVEP